MWDTSRGLRETVVRALAKVGLVWALAVLGAVFMATASQGDRPDGGDSPSTAGLALALVMLGGGISVLAVGAARERGGPESAS